MWYIILVLIGFCLAFKSMYQEPYKCPKCLTYQMNTCYDNCKVCKEKLYWTNRVSEEAYFIFKTGVDVGFIKKLDLDKDKYDNL